MKTHMLVKPLTYEELLKECQQKGIDVTLIGYNEKSGLAGNCCLSKECPFYLVVKGQEFKKHLQIWKNKIPRSFHAWVAS
jgi:hypothetical protein